MSFEYICSGCGAPSGPSVGVCPFCKSIMVNENSNGSGGLASMQKLYSEGKLERALAIGNLIYKSQPETRTDFQFVLVFVKILLESEAPSSQIRSILAEVSLVVPDNPEVLDYIELVEAKSCLRKGINDPGEVMLKSILRRSPRNAHAHFILGAHLFWVEGELASAITHLETCVRLQPNFLRAWGCLGVIYRKLGNMQLAQTAFNQCAKLESSPSMREFFLEQAKAS